jgi:cytochrome bd-type quinol oxidase subunit 2
VVETRARIVNAAGETVPWPLVFMLAIMGLAVLVVSTLLDTQHRKSHVAILTALALLVSLTLALVVSLNFPFDGILPISDAPLRNFLAFRGAR